MSRRPTQTAAVYMTPSTVAIPGARGAILPRPEEVLTAARAAGPARRCRPDRDRCAGNLDLSPPHARPSRPPGASRARPLPAGRAVVDHRAESPRVGRRASKAPYLHRPRRRSAQPAAAGILARADSERL